MAGNQPAFRERHLKMEDFMSVMFECLPGRIVGGFNLLKHTSDMLHCDVFEQLLPNNFL